MLKTVCLLIFFALSLTRTAPAQEAASSPMETTANAAAVLSDQAQAAFQMDDFTSAVTFSEQCIQRFGSQAKDAYVAKNDPVLRRLINKVAMAYYINARCHEKQGDFERARKLYTHISETYNAVQHENQRLSTLARARLSLPHFSSITGAAADKAPEFSQAGYYALPESPRTTSNFNVGWRFFLGDASGAETGHFDDRDWPLVNVPHGLEFLPKEASGSLNYQGVAWYRKHFSMPAAEQGRKHFLHFEAIMGKSKIWVNGKLMKAHFGGYLPAVVDVSDALYYDGQENIVAVQADNSDDPAYPPGKSNLVMDFAYFGGIYRDVWFVSHNKVYITHPNDANKPAGGGLFVHCENVGDKQATVVVKAEVNNAFSGPRDLQLLFELKDKNGALITSAHVAVPAAAGKTTECAVELKVDNPHLWEPDTPYLYHLCATVQDSTGTVLDGVRIRTGIRSIEFRGQEGFFLNGKHYPEKLIGGNRHQDFAHIGNALPNSLHYRDAKKLRDLGFRVVRSAHYPQDPAFMDACDELGLFVIVATPGWQFWNEDPIFGERVLDDIRNMVRRDRNHPCVLIWESSLNESHYPAEFARKTHTVVHTEYPYPGAYTAADPNGHRSWFNNDIYDVLYEKMTTTEYAHGKSGFQREWGDNVDSWSAHNSNSRAYMGWGERPMLVQALHYAGSLRVPHTMNLDTLYKAPVMHVGGTMWHSFDHQRGYHPDPFYGGILDSFRLPKTAAYLFESQRDPGLVLPTGKTGPMLYIAHEVTPFSDDDVWIFSNCDEVRLTVMGRSVGTKPSKNDQPGIPHPPVVFKDAYDWQAVKETNRKGEIDHLNITAEGLIDGKVVIKTVKMPALRKTRLVLKIDDEDTPLVADGSDLMTVVAYATDDYGNVKRLCNDQIKFTVSGAGYLWDAEHLNTIPLEWGMAPNLIRSSTEPGEIFIKAEVADDSLNGMSASTLRIKSVASPAPLLFKEEPGKIRWQKLGVQPQVGLEAELEKVSAQQSSFEQ